jgi:perosamine synthetase
VYQPDLSGNEKRYVNECLESTWISSKGRFVGQFEEAFASYLGAGHAASVSNGTVALHVSLVALGIGPGDEVIVPTLTYIASVNAITYVGATPVFVDSLSKTWQMDPAAVEAAVTAKTRAILCVHLYGHPCEMDALLATAREHDLLVIEDCAEAIGSRYRGRHVGTFGDIATFSFFGNKTITTGEGGMVVTDNAELHRRVSILKDQGNAPDRAYWHDTIGYNYRMTNIQAAIGVAQLESVDRRLEQKKQIAAWYQEDLASAGMSLQGAQAHVEHSYWMCCALLPEGQSYPPVRDAMAELGIETRPVFHPVHTMPMYGAGSQDFPVAERLSERGINLPSWPGLGREGVKVIRDSLLENTR